mmetsp:Transcript_13372/g.34084  ORF Transcript_13372/g.34084 Transcript_13372/m.34084 type:complete len:225 (-) Transcript_13372:231-905(-)
MKSSESGNLAGGAKGWGRGPMVRRLSFFLLSERVSAAGDTAVEYSSTSMVSLCLYFGDSGLERERLDVVSLVASIFERLGRIKTDPPFFRVMRINCCAGVLSSSSSSGSGVMLSGVFVFSLAPSKPASLRGGRELARGQSRIRSVFRGLVLPTDLEPDTRGNDRPFSTVSRGLLLPADSDGPWWARSSVKILEGTKRWLSWLSSCSLLMVCFIFFDCFTESRSR